MRIARASVRFGAAAAACGGEVVAVDGPAVAAGVEPGAEVP
jgi:hypothetical protein